MCNSNKCAICTCSENEIPQFWKAQQSLQPLSFNHFIQSYQKECPDTLEEWCANEEEDRDAVYVNLEINVESYTAYQGKDIWKAIYYENCMIDSLKHIDMENTCSEETLLYQLVSGLHSSINMHVSKNYYDPETNSTLVNYHRYLNAIGRYEDRLKNLFFIYAAVLRAVTRAGPMLTEYDYSTGLNHTQDEYTQQLIE